MRLDSFDTTHSSYGLDSSQGLHRNLTISNLTHATKTYFSTTIFPRNITYLANQMLEHLSYKFDIVPYAFTYSKLYIQLGRAIDI